MKDRFIRNAQTQFLRETVEFYNINNICRSKTSLGCQYHPSETSPGCAIGRHIANKQLCESWSEYEWKEIVGPGKGFVHSIVKELPGTLGPLEVLGVGFLGRVQELHDYKGNWTTEGISARGIGLVRDICCLYDLPLAQVLVDNCAKNGN